MTASPKARLRWCAACAKAHAGALNNARKVRDSVIGVSTYSEKHQ